ncbi:acyltransferase family protein [Phocaeicola vulgatus]|uniref:acyltransferase family protein n=1 Tax=Phocaeicola vulgatus TaxID=821 RepID=UPI003AF2A4ED
MVCGHTSIPLSISNWIWSFHMPLFFIISGILFNATKYPNFNLFIKKRGKTLIIPYIIFSLITLLTIHDQTLKEWLYKGWINGCALWFIPVLFFAEIFFLFHYSLHKFKLFNIINSNYNRNNWLHVIFFQYSFSV